MKGGEISMFNIVKENAYLMENGNCSNCNQKIRNKISNGKTYKTRILFKNTNEEERIMCPKCKRIIML